MKKDNPPRIRLFSILLLFLTIVAIPASANTFSPQSESISFISENNIYVDDDYNSSTPGWGVDHFDNIQDAIDNASDGDTIYVFSGVYYENVVVDKRVNLTGEDKTSTIIDGSDTGKVVSITKGNVDVDGFTIRNSGPYFEDAGVYVGSYSNTITNNIIMENQHGVYIVDAKSNNILENTMTNCKYGMYIINSDLNSLKENTITKNQYGVYLQESSLNDVHGNIVKDNEDGIWLKLYSKENTIVGNTITKNLLGRGLLLDRFCDNNIIHHNNFIDNEIHARFILSFFNTWEYNYWDNWVGIIIEGWHIFPKVIFGQIGPIPWINFDWYPLSVPLTVGPPQQ